MPDGMDEAHKRDTRLQNDYRVARAALLAVADNAPAKVAAEALEMAERLKREEDHIVARWN